MRSYLQSTAPQIRSTTPRLPGDVWSCPRLVSNTSQCAHGVEKHPRGDETPTLLRNTNRVARSSTARCPVTGKRRARFPCKEPEYKRALGCLTPQTPAPLNGVLPCGWKTGFRSTKAAKLNKGDQEGRMNKDV
ncbi:unnamed protein product [Arctogadus glacialis]